MDNNRYSVAYSPTKEFFDFSSLRDLLNWLWGKQIYHVAIFKNERIVNIMPAQSRNIEDFASITKVKKIIEES